MEVKKVSRAPYALTLSLSLSADADPESFYSDKFHAVLVEKGREDPNTTEAGRNRPFSETPFDDLGSSREQ